MVGDVRERLREVPDASVQTCVTSPPYFGLRDYGHAGQIGLESSPDAYVAELVAVFREVRRVLRDDGTLWLNLGDSYSGSGPSGASYQSATTKARAGQKRDGSFAISATLEARGLTYAEKKPIPAAGLKAKDLIGIPWRVAFALQADGWYLRSDIIWAKPNPMPESVTDRPTKSHEYLFLLSKSERYYYDADAIAEPAEKGAAGSTFNGGKTATHQLGRSSDVPREDSGTRNKRTVWTVPTSPYKGAHFATFPPALIEPCILAGSNTGDTVLDPFGGAGTTGLVADRLGRNAILCELNPAYAKMAYERIVQDNPMFSGVTTE